MMDDGLVIEEGLAGALLHAAEQRAHPPVPFQDLVMLALALRVDHAIPSRHARRPERREAHNRVYVIDKGTA